MKAVYCLKYGKPEVLQIKEIEKPKIKKDEILVKVKFASVTAADTMIRKGTPKYGRVFLGLFRPKHQIIGTGFSGEVTQIGKEVTSYKIGDKVFGETGLTFGANAEFLAVSEKGIINLIPNGVSFEEAAPICDGHLTSYNFLKQLGNIKRGDKVLINGASGSLGVAAVQMATYFGAEVTGVCSNANKELVKSLGADEVIDYNNQDFTKLEIKYDLVFDTIGKSSYSECKRILTTKGIYMSPVLSLDLLCSSIRTSILKKKRAKFSATGMLKVTELNKMLLSIIKMMEKGVLKSVIEKEYSINEIVNAHRHIETGRKKGNIVLKMN